MKRKKKNILKKIIKTSIAWFFLFVFIITFPPENILFFALFYLLFFLSIYITLKIFFKTLRSFYFAILIIIFLIFRQQKMDNIINNILLIGILLSLEIYFRKG